jgi:ribose transport system ATP-binding protein
MEIRDALCLKMEGIEKRFPGVHALKNVSLTLGRGEIRGLLGENGAGKSTLMKILSGVYIPDDGEIYIYDKKVNITAPLDAQKLGISFIHQELSLFLDLDIATNLYMHDLPSKGNVIINEKELRKNTQNLLDVVGLGKHKPAVLVKNLQMGERQLVEIARCLAMDTKILVLDEPTSSLTQKEVETLFGLMNTLKSQGISIIFISHRMDEIFTVCDTITVMRDGEKIDTVNAKTTSTRDVVRMMIGRDLAEMYSREHITPGKELLRIEDMNRLHKFSNISFSVHKGEIVGLFGLLGSGRSEIARSIFGLEKFDGGVVYVEGKKVSIHQPLDAIKNGIGLITENRREEGLMLQQSVLFNVTVTNLPAYASRPLGRMNTKKEIVNVDESVQRFNIKTPNIYRLTQFLSGGNQQKIVIAKWVNCAPKVLILDEPTRGVDVGAKAEIYRILSELVKDGKGIFVISSELNEIMGLCDRILVIRKGKIVKEFQKFEFEKKALLEACMGDTG